MENDKKVILSKLRLEYAKEELDAAKGLLKLSKYRTAISRLYYSVFYAMRAVLALDGIDRKKHSSVISEFRKLYIKTKIFSKDIANIATVLFDMRLDSDYRDFFTVSKQTVEEQLVNADYFIKEIEKHLKEKY